MLIKGLQIKSPILVLNLVLILTASSVNAVDLRKLDEEKCGSCSGTTTYPSPPPPAIPPPSPPLPKKSKPSQYCPPPPSPPSSFIYITGPPGNLYPVDENFSGATNRRRGWNFAAALLPLLVGMLAFW